MCVSCKYVCVCVCERERERERDRGKSRQRQQGRGGEVNRKKPGALYTQKTVLSKLCFARIGYKKPQ